MFDRDLPVGVSAEDLQTISLAGISPSPINTFGLVGYFDRGTPGVIRPASQTDVPTMLGRFRSGYNGMYGLKGALDELFGQPGQAHVLRLIPTDSATASASILNHNATPVATLKLHAGRKGVKDPGVWGNQLWVLPVATSRASSVVTVAGAALDNFITVQATTLFSLYDYVSIGTTPIERQIIGIDEANNRLILNSALGAVVALDSAVAVKDFTLRVYTKDSDIGVFSDPVSYSNLTMDIRSQHYWAAVINDAFTGSDFLFAEQLVTADNGTVTDFPVCVADSLANAINLTGGLNGTALTTVEMAAQYAQFNPYSIRYLGNMESQALATYIDGEAYCAVRGDCMWVGCPTMATASSYSGLYAYASQLQRTRKVFAWNAGNWIYVTDPLSPIGAFKAIPNIGHRIGLAIRLTEQNGVHRVLADRKTSFVSVRGLVTEFVDPDQIRNLANIGMNVMNDFSGEIVLRTGRTPSKLPEWTFTNAVNMATYFKLSYVNSLVNYENQTNNDELLANIVGSMKDFAHDFYLSSSNGGNEGGFASGSFTAVTRFDYGSLINRRSSIQAGVVRVNFYFIPPAPAERIRVGVGQMTFQTGG